MMNFDEYCQSMLDMSPAEKVEAGREAFVIVYGWLKEIGVEEKNRSFMIDALIRAGVSGDFSCDGDELSLYNAIFDTNKSPEDFYEMTNGGADSEFLNDLDSLVDDMPTEVKFAACTLVAAFLTADDKLTANEAGVLCKLMA